MSMLEVLITLVLLAIGLLGIAGLQLTGIKFTHNANVRYQAMLQATDMADRMRANLAGVTAGAYNNISGIGSDPNCIASRCSPTQMAQTDQFAWNSANLRLLPQGAGTVTRNGNTYQITITWQEKEGVGTADTSQQLQMGIEP